MKKIFSATYKWGIVVGMKAEMISSQETQQKVCVYRQQLEMFNLTSLRWGGQTWPNRRE
jgi:hypothetical protein